MTEFHFHRWRQPLSRSFVKDLKYLALTGSIILIAYTPIFQLIFFAGPDVLGSPANTIAGALLVSFVPRILARLWSTFGGGTPAKQDR